VNSNQSRSLSEEHCTSQFVYRIHTRGWKRDPTPHWENAENVFKDLKCTLSNGGSQIEQRKMIVVFNHNIINMCFTANKSTKYTSYYSKVYEVL